MAVIKTHHINLQAAKYDEMLAFYTETLGFPILGRLPGTDTVFIDIGSTTFELCRAKTDGPAEAPPVGVTHVALEVDDVDAVYNEWKAKGVEFYIEPRDAFDIRLAFFRDPDGNAIELFKSPTLSW